MVHCSDKVMVKYWLCFIPPLEHWPLYWSTSRSDSGHCYFIKSLGENTFWRVQLSKTPRISVSGLCCGQQHSAGVGSLMENLLRPKYQWQSCRGQSFYRHHTSLHPPSRQAKGIITTQGYFPAMQRHSRTVKSVDRYDLWSISRLTTPGLGWARNYGTSQLFGPNMKPGMEDISGEGLRSKTEVRTKITGTDLSSGWPCCSSKFQMEQGALSLYLFISLPPALEDPLVGLCGRVSPWAGDSSL